MKEVDFYILSKNDKNYVNLFVCKLSEKAYNMSKSVIIFTSNKEKSVKLSEMLWSFKKDCFLPNEIEPFNCKNTKNCISLIHKESSLSMSDVLINYSDVALPELNKATRILEIVQNNEIDKSKARQKYIKYKKSDYQIRSHNI